MVSQEDIFQISSKKEFEKITLKVFRHQYDTNLVYQQFCNFLKKDKNNVKSITEIPFLPIQFFKSHNVLSSSETIQQTFTSSGTTGMQTSKHLVTDVSWYEMSYRLGFSEFYGNIEDYCVLALLPSYLERDGSSLIYMVEDLIQSSNHSASGEWRALEGSTRPAALAACAAHKAVCLAHQPSRFLGGGSSPDSIAFHRAGCFERNAGRPATPAAK